MNKSESISGNSLTPQEYKHNCNRCPIKILEQIEGQQDECNACGAIEESEQDIEELVLPGSSKADDNYPDGCTDEEVSMGYQLYSSPL